MGVIKGQFFGDISGRIGSRVFSRVPSRKIVRSFPFSLQNKIVNDISTYNNFKEAVNVWNSFTSIEKRAYSNRACHLSRVISGFNLFLGEFLKKVKPMPNPPYSEYVYLNLATSDILDLLNNELTITLTPTPDKILYPRSVRFQSYGLNFSDNLNLDLKYRGSNSFFHCALASGRDFILITNNFNFNQNTGYIAYNGEPIQLFLSNYISNLGNVNDLKLVFEFSQVDW
jgi:hypothetical protein